MKHFLLITAVAIIISCGNDENNRQAATTPNNTAPTPDSVSAQTVAESFVSPLYLTQPKDDNRLFVVDQTGQIYIIENGQRVAQPFLDVKSRLVNLKPEHEERGLLGLAFHPDYKSNGKFYVYYNAPLRSSAPSGWDNTATLAEFKVSASNPNVADTTSGRILLQLDKPQYNHNGGTITFGPDGYLYLSIGDGGGANDNEMGHVEDWYAKNKGGNGQDVMQNLMGSILRIDVNNGSPYGIPSDNPFADGENGLKEIYAYGLRNPYRFSFAPDGSLIAADAGQELYEEIDVIEKGGNYGWNVKEGRHCFSAANNKRSLDSCPSNDAMGNRLIDPVIEFKNNKNNTDGLGIVSVGGVVYNASGVEGLKGKYLFGVWTQKHEKPDGAVFAADRTGNDWQYKKLLIKGRPSAEIGQYVLGFGSDNAGNSYVLTTGQNGPKGNTGKVLMIAK